MELIEVTKDQLVDGKEYLTLMKHGWLSGDWDAEEENFGGYYWRDMEWCGTRFFEMPVL